MQLLRWLAESLESLLPEARSFRPVMFVNELEQTLKRELDYVNEASATARFREAFAGVPGIRIHAVDWDLSVSERADPRSSPGYECRPDARALGWRGRTD